MSTVVFIPVNRAPSVRQAEPAKVITLPVVRVERKEVPAQS